METKATKLSTALKILKKNVEKSTDETEIKNAQRWIDIFNMYDGETTIQYESDPVENRVLYILEKNKDAIIAQLPESFSPISSAAPGEPVVLPGTPGAPVAENIGEGLELEGFEIDEHQPPFEPEAPAMETAPAAEGIVSILTRKDLPHKLEFDLRNVEHSFSSAPTGNNGDSFADLFSEAQAAANNANTSIYNVIATAFQLLERNNIQALAEMEERITRRLSAIYKTSCIAANNTETQKPMYAAFEQIDRFKAEFAE